MSNQYWFARRFPVGHKSNALAPVTKEGRMVGLRTREAKAHQFGAGRQLLQLLRQFEFQ